MNRREQPQGEATRAQTEGGEKPRWVCSRCGNTEYQERNVICWKCGKGEMLYRDPSSPRVHAEQERDKLADDLAKTADWYQRMERAEKALREAQELIEGALRNGDWERVKRALASLKSSEGAK